MPSIITNSVVLVGLSRPGNAYPNLISRMLDCDHINLGFSGSGKAEDEIASYISQLDMSVLVYDYDHNAPDPDYLKATRESMFLKIRKANPTLPVIMLSAPKFPRRDADIQQRRLDIIRRTYENAIAAGDTNVYLIPGSDLLGEALESATVDNSHPNDKGVEKILGASGSTSGCAQLKEGTMKRANFHFDGGEYQETSLTIFLCVPHLSIWLSFFYFKSTFSYLGFSHGHRSSPNDLRPKEGG